MADKPTTAPKPDDDPVPPKPLMTPEEGANQGFGTPGTPAEQVPEELENGFA